MDKLRYIINIIIVALMIGAIAINRDGRIMGHSVVDEQEQESSSKTTITDSAQKQLSDGTIVINTTSIGKDIIGYAGRTPLEVYIKDEVITNVEPLDNIETPSFFQQMVNGGILEKWVGMDIEDAITAKVDVVSGATFSSQAVIKNVQRAASHHTNIEAQGSNNPFSDIDIKTILGILTIIFGVIITICRPKRKIFETIQMVLNVAILGFWCSSFLSLSQFVTWISNGVNLSVSILGALLLLVVIIMPLFNRKGSYCHIHCPMGSAQALMAKVPFTKIKFGKRVSKFLNNLRYYILSALLFTMWIGVGFKLLDYEIFPAFIVESASTGILIAAGLFLILSMFITKPYCRFVCPTGALLTIMQKSK